MIPITQTRTGPDGNCFSACLASILEVPLHVIPEFALDEDLFLDQIQEFLLPHGLFYLQVAPDDPMLEHVFRTGETWHTIEGVSPRGGGHACVGLNGEISFDPHPEDGTGRGLVQVEVFGLFCNRMID